MLRRLQHGPSAIPRDRQLNEQLISAEVPPGVPAELLERRSDIMQAEQDPAAAIAAVGVAHSSYGFPNSHSHGRSKAPARPLDGRFLL